VNARGRVVIGLALALYLVGTGMLVGVIVERMRFDRHRGEIVTRYERALRARNVQLMGLEARGL
jgi:hypothetical protein